MIEINNNGIITMNMGDTFSYPLFINAGDKLTPIRYKLRDLDSIEFAIERANDAFANAPIKKTYTKANCNVYGDVVINLTSADTNNLGDGKFYYEIKLHLKPNANTEYIQTIVPKRKFIILR